jgi:hypothetical protein
MTLNFKKSSYSGGANNCVEVAIAQEGDGAREPVVYSRDSKNPDGGVVRVNLEQWLAFLHFVAR